MKQNIKEILDITKRNTICFFDTMTHKETLIQSYPQAVNSLYYQFTIAIYKALNFSGQPIKFIVPSNKSSVTSKTVLQFSDRFKNNKFCGIPVQTIDITDFKNEEFSVIIQTDKSYYLLRILNWG